MDLMIKMARGDVEIKNFTVKQNGSAWSETPDEIYFTVKSNANDKDYKFQKRLSDGGIVLVETGKYQIKIEPEDTNGLSFSKYDFDIEIVKHRLCEQSEPVSLFRQFRKYC